MAKIKLKSEHSEQAVFMSRVSLEHPTLLIFAIPNGAQRGAWEAAQKKAEGLLAGVPDVYVEEARGGWFGLRIEFKRADQMRKKNGGRTEDQIRIHRQLAARGYLAVTAYGAAMALEHLNAYLRLPLTVVSACSFARAG